jgi:MerR family transcriptional regulator, copper efflux regulator
MVVAVKDSDGRHTPGGRTISEQVTRLGFDDRARPMSDRGGVAPDVAAPTDAGEQAPPGSGCWRIDDLAQRAELTVDTIRYYQREGLLPPAERAGRLKLYGPQHLQRLERIRDLQARRFSLAAIRALLDEDRKGIVDGIFADAGGRTYPIDELIERAGIDPELALALKDSGLLRDPQEYGREDYDSDDLELLRTMAELARLGMPTAAIVELGRIYATGIEAMQREVIDLFATGGRLDWSTEQLHEFQELSATIAVDVLPLARRLVDYTHSRTIQRLALGAIEHGVAEPAPDV